MKEKGEMELKRKQHNSGFKAKVAPGCCKAEKKIAELSGRYGYMLT
jgi:hypothetical protein